MTQRFQFVKGNSPLVISAIHDGHLIRDELKDLFLLSDSERLREEDPFTATWTNISDNRIIVNHSRFETDVNRPREKAVYQKPEDAWGLEVWKTQLPQETLQRSLAFYDDFYTSAKVYFDELFSLHGRIIVYDLHSYNYQRDGPGKGSDPLENPEVNIGTINMDQELWRLVIETLIDSFRAFNFDGRSLDVRENIKFKGGYFGKWLFKNYGQAICPISIEFKKFFMDEHTGEAIEKYINLISELINASIPAVLDVLQKIDKSS